MVQNLAWAAGYNIVAIPLAAGALAWAGVTLSPAVGAILMSLSTIVVALNAQLLPAASGWPGRADVAHIPPRGIIGMKCASVDVRIARREARRVRRRARVGVLRRRRSPSAPPLGPEPSRARRDVRHDAAHDDAAPTGDAGARRPGAVSSGGYTLDLRTPVVDGRPTGPQLALVIEGPDGRPVTDLHDRARQGAAPGRRQPRSRRLRPPPPDRDRRACGR